MLSFVTDLNGHLPAGVEQQLDRVLASEAFRNAPRLSEFLRFSVEAALRGEAGQIKEYLVGVEVFGRGTDYDPRIDPVVRVEARRLRAKLREYYEEEGRQDALRIHFPKGGYVAVFEGREEIARESESGALPAETSITAGSAARPPQPEQRAGRRLPSRRTVVLVAAGTAAAAAAGLSWFVQNDAGSAARNRIAVLPMRAYTPSVPEDVQLLADGIAEAILSELSRHRDLSVVSWPTVAGYRAAGKAVPEISRELGAAYVAGVGVRRDPERLVVTIHIVDGAADRKLWAEGYDFPPETKSLPADFARNIASEIVRRLRGATE